MSMQVWMAFLYKLDFALEMWQKSAGDNAMIVNTKGWDDTWKAVGVGVYEQYAVIWFGKEVDSNRIIK